MTASPKLHGDRPSGDAGTRRTADRHLIALTRDPLLAQALQDLAGGDVTIHLVEDLRRLADELMQHGTAVALLDAQSLGVPVDAAVDAVKNQFPEVRLMVAGHAAEQHQLSTRIAQLKVFRFVHKPASPQRLKLFLDAASHQHEVAHTGTTMEIPALSGAAQPPRGGLSPQLMGAALAAVAVLAAGGWWVLRNEDQAPAPTANAASSAATPQVTELLARAADAFAAGRFVAADGSGAAELYRQALRMDGNNTAATEGFERAVESALAGAEQALLAGEIEQARVTAETVRLVEPDNSRLAFLYSQIERELTRVNADVTQRQAFDTRQAQIRAAVATVAARIDRGALLEPANDSAVVRFRETQALGGGDPLVRASRDALVSALLTSADTELAAGRSAAARRLVDAAGSVNSSASGLDIMRRRIGEAAAPATSTASVSPAPAPAASEPAAAPALVTAPVSPTPAPVAGMREEVAPVAAPARAQDIISASTLRTERRPDPVYPSLALQQSISGWVEMVFTIQKDGSVRDVEIAESEPGRTFDAAAVSAMKRYRYAPIVRDGLPIEQRARLRMRFTAEN